MKTALGVTPVFYRNPGGSLCLVFYGRLGGLNFWDFPVCTSNLTIGMLGLQRQAVAADIMWLLGIRTPHTCAALSHPVSPWLRLLISTHGQAAGVDLFYRQETWRMLGRGRTLGNLRSSQHRAGMAGYLEAEVVCIESITLV